MSEGFSGNVRPVKSKSPYAFSPITNTETSEEMITARNTRILLFKMKFSINTIPLRKMMVGRHIRKNDVIYGIILKGLTANDN